MLVSFSSFIPVSRTVNIRSVETVGSTPARFATCLHKRASKPCLAIEKWVLEVLKSVQEVSKQSAGARYGKTDVRYWRKRIFRPSYTRNGSRCSVGHYAVKLQYAGRRESIPQETANSEIAAQKAREIYLFLKANGWDQTIAKFKPSKRRADSEIETVGEFFRLDRHENIWR